jgi:very-short-patch-repair endonuclease
VRKYIREIKKSYTKGQLKLGKLITGLGFPVDYEEPFPPYWVDVYVREIHCGFEYDGMGHSWKKRDRDRDSFLLDKYGLPIMRVNDDMNEEEIVRFIDKWAVTAKDRKWRAE